MFYDALDSFGDRVALVDPARNGITYRELAARADEVARQLGTGRTVVAIEAANTVATVVAYLAVLRSRNVVLLLDAAMPVEWRTRLYDQFAVPRVLDGASGDRPVLSSRDASPAELHVALAQLLSTSGSTGSPKLVRLAATSVDANARSISEYLALTDSERAITTLPLHYSYGLSILNSHLAVGASVVVTEASVTAREFWDLFRETNATSLAGVPATWEILQRLRFAKMSLPSLRYCTQAGGRLNVATMQYFAEWAAASSRRFFVMYGQTEATARISYVPPDRLLEKLGSIGVAIPRGELSLSDPEGTPVSEVGAQGEIVYRGPNVMLGYAESASDLARGNETGGVLRTGDVGYRDADGFFYITGRLKRFAKLFGNRVNLDDVEALLRAHDVTCAVTEHDDRLLIGVESNDPTEVSRIVCAELKVHHSAVAVLRVEAIPRNAAGKVLYPELARAFAVSTKPEE